jgi:hypothetical protein
MRIDYNRNTFTAMLVGVLLGLMLTQMILGINQFVENEVKPQLQQMVEDAKYLGAKASILRLQIGDRFEFSEVSYLGHDMFELAMQRDMQPIYVDGSISIVTSDLMPARMDHPYQLYKFGRDLLDRPALIVLDLDPAVLVAQPNPESSLPETVPSSDSDPQVLVNPFVGVSGYIKLFRTADFGVYDIHDSSGYIVHNVRLNVVWPDGHEVLNRWISAYSFWPGNGATEVNVDSFAPESVQKPDGCSNLDYSRYGDSCEQHLTGQFAFPFCEALQTSKRVMVYYDFEGGERAYVLIAESGETYHGDVNIRWPHNQAYDYGSWFQWNSCGQNPNNGEYHLVLS